LINATQCSVVTKFTDNDLLLQCNNYKIKIEREKKASYVEKMSFFSSVFCHMWTPVLVFTTGR